MPVNIQAVIKPEPEAEAQPASNTELVLADPLDRVESSSTAADAAVDTPPPIEVVVAPESAQQSAPGAVNSASTSIARDVQTSEDWISVFPQLPLEGMLKSICGQLSFRQRDADFLIFDIDRAASGVLSDKYQSKFAELLSQHLGQNLQLSIETLDNNNESPTRRAERLHEEALDAAETDLVSSDAAQKLTQAFDAKLVPGSVSLK